MSTMSREEFVQRYVLACVTTPQAYDQSNPYNYAEMISDAHNAYSKIKEAEQELCPKADEPEIPVIWELDENDEATGTTYRFCSDQCADGFRMEDLEAQSQLPKYKWGKEPASCAVDGEICTKCGEELP